MLMFMCRDPGDTTSKVSCCVEPSQCFKNSDFDAIANTVNLKSPFFRRNYAFTQRFDLGTFTKKALVAFW